MCAQQSGFSVAKVKTLPPRGKGDQSESPKRRATTHRDVWPDGDDHAVLDVHVGLLRPVRVHHRPALDQDPRAVPSAAAAPGGSSSRGRAELQFTRTTKIQSRKEKKTSQSN